MKGYELIRRITDKQIPEESKIKVFDYNGNLVTTLEVKNNGLIWESGLFTTSELCNIEFTFEIDENKQIDDDCFIFLVDCINILIENFIEEAFKIIKETIKEMEEEENNE